MAPAVPIDTKFCVRDTVLPSGVLLKQGCAAVWSAYILGRSPQYFDSPEEFRPERFLDPDLYNGGKSINAGNLAFQFGPRRCLGERQAYLEVIAVLARLVRDVQFQIPEQTFVFEPSITLYSSTGVMATAQRIKLRL